MPLNYQEGGTRIFLSLAGLQGLAVCVILILSLTVTDAPIGLVMLGGALGSIALTLFLGINLMERFNTKPLYVVAICWLPFAAFFAYLGFFLGALAVAGGWTPPFGGGQPFKFSESIYLVALAGAIIFAVPVMPLLAIEWIVKGFTTKG